MKIRRVGLDPASLFGYAWTDSDDVVPHQVGVWDLRHTRYQGGGMVFLRLERYLLGLEPDEVAFELVRGHTGTNAAQLYGGWVATVSAWCEQRSIPYRGIHTGSVKRHATGNGNAKKEAMMKAAKTKLGYEGKSEDEVDALWVLSAYLQGVE